MSDSVSRGRRQAVPGDQSMGFRPLAGEPDPFAPYPGAGAGQFVEECRLEGFASERELASRVLERLEPWFAVRREVWGTHCSGERLRIDAMLRPRDGRGWRNPDVAFGVEFKSPRSATGLKWYTGWIAQAVDYTHVDWDGYGRRVILTCPGAASVLDVYPGSRDASGDLLVAKRLMGQLGVGELVVRWAHGLTILLNGERIWSERHGVGYGKSWNLTVRSGSR